MAHHFDPDRPFCFRCQVHQEDALAAEECPGSAHAAIAKWSGRRFLAVKAPGGCYVPGRLTPAQQRALRLLREHGKAQTLGIHGGDFYSSGGPSFWISARTIEALSKRGLVKIIRLTKPWRKPEERYGRDLVGRTIDRGERRLLGWEARIET